MPNQGSSKQSHFDIAIIGAGFAGIGAAIKLKQEANDSLIIFERAKEIGGTWRDNIYPGCGCDVPSFLYSYSFEPNPNWSQLFSPQSEILDYLKHCVNKYGLEPNIKYNTNITSLKFDEQKGNWAILDSAGNQTIARIVISAAGPFRAPNIPKIKGAETFQGKAFHSLNWNHNFDLNNKKVAVIGTGASAIQFIPKISKEVEQLTIFQRTAPWIMPKDNQQFSSKSKGRFKKYPSYQKFWRELIYWFLEFRGRSLYSKNWIRKMRVRECLKHLDEQISSPELKKKLTPNYELGCKRVLVSSNYYPSLQLPNVDLINEAVQEICPSGIRKSDGEIVDVDLIIYGTGFHATTFNDIFEVIGRDGKSLFEKWNSEGAEAFLGTTISGYPNLFIMVGPNSGLGHNSIIHMMESQFNYILDFLKKLKNTNEKNSYFDLKQDVQNKFNNDIQDELSKMVWNDGGCKSYYLKDGNGKNSSIWPGSTMRFRKKTKKVNFKNYNLIIPN